MRKTDEAGGGARDLHERGPTMRKSLAYRLVTRGDVEIECEWNSKKLPLAVREADRSQAPGARFDALPANPSEAIRLRLRRFPPPPPPPICTRASRKIHEIVPRWRQI